MKRNPIPFLLAALCIALGTACQQPPPDPERCPQVDLPIDQVNKSASFCNKTLARGFAQLEIDKVCKAGLERAGKPCRGECSNRESLCHLSSLTDPDRWTYTQVDDESCNHEGGVQWTATYNGPVSCACTCLN